MISADKADKDFMKERTGLLFLIRKATPLSFYPENGGKRNYGYKENNAEGKTAGTRNPGC